MSVANRPCGAPSYSTSVAFAMPAAAARPAASIGTVLSSVPWMIKVGTLNAARSRRKSVVANDLAHSSVAFRLDCIARLRVHSSVSALTGFEIRPTP